MLCLEGWSNSIPLEGQWPAGLLVGGALCWGGQLGQALRLLAASPAGGFSAQDAILPQLALEPELCLLPHVFRYVSLAVLYALCF